MKHHQISPLTIRIIEKQSVFVWQSVVCVASVNQSVIVSHHFQDFGHPNCAVLRARNMGHRHTHTHTPTHFRFSQWVLHRQSVTQRYARRVHTRVLLPLIVLLGIQKHPKQSLLVVIRCDARRVSSCQTASSHRSHVCDRLSARLLNIDILQLLLRSLVVRHCNRHRCVCYRYLSYSRDRPNTTLKTNWIDRARVLLNRKKRKNNDH